MKSNLLEGTLRLNATIFNYVYSDLQVQQFDAVAIQFTTLNASELTTKGFEADLLWQTPVEGLMVRGALAYTDAQYTEDFFTDEGENLRGEDRERNAEWTGYAGITYDWSVTNRWRMNVSGDARFSDGYSLQAALNPWRQDSYWLLDTAVRFYRDDMRYELAFIGRNLGNEIVAYSSGARPGACANADVTNPDLTQRCNVGVVGVDQDQVVNTRLGTELMLQLQIRF